MLKKSRWVAVVAALVVVGLVVGVFVSVGVSLPAKKSDLPTVGPTANELEQLAAELSSGTPARILASIADLPPGAEKDVLKTFTNIKFVDFNTQTVRFDKTTGAAVVDARLTPRKGQPTYEREALVKRGTRWLLYSSLPKPKGT